MADFTNIIAELVKERSRLQAEVDRLTVAIDALTPQTTSPLAPDATPVPAPPPAPMAPPTPPPRVKPSKADPKPDSAKGRIIRALIELGHAAGRVEVAHILGRNPQTVSGELSLVLKDHPHLVERPRRGRYQATDKARELYQVGVLQPKEAPEATPTAPTEPAPEEEPAPVPTPTAEPDRELRTMRPSWWTIRRKGDSPIRINLSGKGPLPDGHTAIAVGIRKNGEPGYGLELDGRTVYDWWPSPDAAYRAAVRLLSEADEGRASA